MKKTLAFLILIVSVIFIFQPIFASAGPAVNAKFNEGLKKTGNEAGYPKAADENPGSFLFQMLGRALTPMFMGVTAMIILIYGGYTLLMARGDEQKVEKAKTIIANTIMALIVVFSAYAILRLILPLWEFVTKK